MRSEEDRGSRVLDMVLIGNDILSRDNENLGSRSKTMALFYIFLDSDKMAQFKFMHTTYCLF
jgi:hypothetical protein